MSSEITERRLVLFTVFAWVVLTLASLYFLSFQITAGVILGGALSLLNLYWLKKSLGVLLENAANDGKPRFTAAFYILRYLIVGSIIGFAVALRVVSVAGTLVGLLSFAFAILLEAIFQFYLIIFNQEEN